MAREYTTNARTLSPEQKLSLLRQIQQSYGKCKEFGDDKVQLAMQTYEMVSELIEFEIEFEICISLLNSYLSGLEDLYHPHLLLTTVFSEKTFVVFVTCCSLLSNQNYVNQVDNKPFNWFILQYKSRYLSSIHGLANHLNYVKYCYCSSMNLMSVQLDCNKLNTVFGSQVDKHIRRLDTDLARFEADLKEKQIESTDYDSTSSKGNKSKLVCVRVTASYRETMRINIMCQLQLDQGSLEAQFTFVSEASLAY